MQEQNNFDLFHAFVRPLHDASIAYMVTGSVASMTYGEPRMTNDVDLVLSLPAADIARIPTIFPDTDYYTPPVEVMTVEARRGLRGHFNVIHHDTGLKADCYLLGHDTLHRWAWPRRRTLALNGFDAIFAPPEYVIIRKLMYFQEGGSTKHLRDIAGMLSAHTVIDRAALDELAQQHGVVDALHRAVRYDEPP
jgi:hypothetical protein